TADGDLSEDLRTAADDRADDRATKVATVRAVLGATGEGQRAVLVHTFGIGDAHCYWSTADDVLAKALGTPPQLVQSARNNGRCRPEPCPQVVGWPWLPCTPSTGDAGQPLTAVLKSLPAGVAGVATATPQRST